MRSRLIIFNTRSKRTRGVFKIAGEYSYMAYHIFWIFSLKFKSLSLIIGSLKGIYSNIMNCKMEQKICKLLTTNAFLIMGCENLEPYELSI